jgi:SOS-response transcriptional repressor LexA
MRVFWLRPLLFILVTGWQERLREAVTQSGQKQSVIALDAGVTPETLSRILNAAHQRPSLDTVARIAHAVHANVGWLLGERGFALSARQLAELRQVVEFLNTTLLDAPPPRVIVRPNPNAIRVTERVPKRFASLGARLAFQITDDSMSGAAIADGDLLFVKRMRSLSAADGQVVVARVNGVLFAKQLEARGGVLRLLSRNERYAPLDLRQDEIELLGVVVGRAGAPGL